MKIYFRTQRIVSMKCYYLLLLRIIDIINNTLLLISITISKYIFAISTFPLFNIKWTLNIFLLYSRLWNNIWLIISNKLFLCPWINLFDSLCLHSMCRGRNIFLWYWIFINNKIISMHVNVKIIIFYWIFLASS